MKVTYLIRSIYLVVSISFTSRVLECVNSQANSMILDQSGNLITGGFANNEATNRTDFLYARYLPDGLLDTSFNPNGPIPGVLQIPPSLFGFPDTTDTGITGITLDAQGKIVAIGFVNTDGIGSSMVVIRLNQDGTLDTTFNPQGTQGTVPGIAQITHSTFGETGTALALDSKGRIIGVGTSDDGQNLSLVVFRLLSDGTLDTTFNNQTTDPGRFVYSKSNTDSAAQSVALTADDSIIVAGYITVAFQSDFLMLKLTQEGELDQTYSAQAQTPGVIVQDISGFDNQAYALKIDPQGRSVIGGFTSDENGAEFFALARYTPSGELDVSFNAAGLGTGIPGIVSTVTSSPGLTINSSNIRSIALTQTDAIVVAGYTINEASQSFATARYTSDGVLDTTYNPAGPIPGVVIESIFPQANLRSFGQNDSTNQFNAVALGSQGELYATGFEFDGLQNNGAVLSYLANGQLNTAFNPDGLVSGIPGVVITTVGNPLNALGNGITRPIEEDVSGVNPEILKDLENPPKPELPRIHTHLANYMSQEEKLIRGTAAPTALVTLFVDGKELGKTLADTKGLWVLKVPPLVEGNHDLQVVSLNVISGLMLSSEMAHIFAKPQRVGPPVIETPRNSQKIKSGSVTIQGRSAPGLSVNLFIDGKPHKVQSDSVGLWSYTAQSLADGLHEVYATVQVPRQRLPLTSTKIHFTQMGASKIPRIMFPKSGYETTDAYITLKGEGVPQTELVISNEKEVVGKAKVGSDGMWSYTLKTRVGTSTLSVATEKGSQTLERVTIKVKQPIPVSPSSTNDNGLFAGVAVPGSEISFYVDNKRIGTTKADTSGHWAYTPLPNLGLKGSYPITIAETSDQGPSRIIQGSAIFP